jgi:hypothetical protein
VGVPVERGREAAEVAAGGVDSRTQGVVVGQQRALERLRKVEAVAGDEGHGDVERRQLVGERELRIERSQVGIGPHGDVPHEDLCRPIVSTRRITHIYAVQPQKRK